ncbi:MAG: GNAT family N-acetyltransferase [Chloroflexi bacterium]|nr:GNAT family N-acetyltransferase [Chloroflexota bacterium]
MSTKITRAEPRDLSMIEPLWRELSQFHANLGPMFDLALDAAEHWRPFMANCLEDPDWCVLLAQVDGLAAGFISGAVQSAPPVFRQDRYGLVSDAIVTARVRRQGIGTLLYQSLAQWFKEIRVTNVNLSAAVANPGAVAFWHKMGFADSMIRMWTEVK